MSTVALTGSSGLIGTRLRQALTRRGDRVVSFVRDPARARPGDRFWDPASGQVDALDVEGLDAIVHLAGEPIGAGRWTAARRRRILESRVRSTRLLCDALATAQGPPPVLISASAIGYYGNRGESRVDEESEPGEGFLAEVCVAWEDATEAARAAGIRVAQPRIGVVLAREGGALARMLPIFRLGLGGRLGDGRQYLSWIGIEDAVAGLEHALACEALSGPFNLVAPNPVTNAEFTRTLARVLSRPSVLSVPAVALRLAVGEMAQALLLDGARIAPGRLASTGFRFRHPDLEGALRSLLT